MEELKEIEGLLEQGGSEIEERGVKKVRVVVDCRAHSLASVCQAHSTARRTRYRRLHVRRRWRLHLLQPRIAS
jgi:hypothetical protein